MLSCARLNAQVSNLAPLPLAPAKETKLAITTRISPRIAITPNYIKNPPVAYQVTQFWHSERDFSNTHEIVDIFLCQEKEERVYVDEFATPDRSSNSIQVTVRETTA